MRKADVELSYHQGHRGDPMINVKHHLWVPTLISRYRDEGHEFSGDAGFWTWVEETFNDSNDYGLSELNLADDWAREDCWEQATEIAHEIWPGYSTVMVDEKIAGRFTGNKVPRRRHHVQVYSAGRSGGWLVVDGLPHIDEWDAIELGRWRRFNKAVRQLADDEYPYRFIWHLHVNVWEPWVPGTSGSAEHTARVIARFLNALCDELRNEEES